VSRVSLHVRIERDAGICTTGIANSRDCLRIPSIFFVLVVRFTTWKDRWIENKHDDKNAGVFIDHRTARNRRVVAVKKQAAARLSFSAACKAAPLQS
jgi:hypothetical protein